MLGSTCPDADRITSLRIAGFSGTVRAPPGANERIPAASGRGAR
jgi:hypothetical protein